MNDRDKKSASPVLVTLVVIVLLLPLLYVLSIGPAGWLHARGYLTDMSFWMPLDSLVDVPVIGRLLIWYASLWR